MDDRTIYVERHDGTTEGTYAFKPLLVETLDGVEYPVYYYVCRQGVVASVYAGNISVDCDNHPYVMVRNCRSRASLKEVCDTLQFETHNGLLDRVSSPVAALQKRIEKMRAKRDQHALAEAEKELIQRNHETAWFNAQAVKKPWSKATVVLKYTAALKEVDGYALKPLKIVTIHKEKNTDRRNATNPLYSVSTFGFCLFHTWNLETAKILGQWIDSAITTNIATIPLDKCRESMEPHFVLAKIIDVVKPINDTAMTLHKVGTYIP
jgi:hypothetical protein